MVLINCHSHWERINTEIYRIKYVTPTHTIISYQSTYHFSLHVHTCMNTFIFTHIAYFSRTHVRSFMYPVQQPALFVFWTKFPYFTIVLGRRFIHTYRALSFWHGTLNYTCNLLNHSLFMNHCFSKRSFVSSYFLNNNKC